MLTPARIAILAFAAACVGCPGSLNDPASFALDAGGAACPDITQTVFLKVCATANCHSASVKLQGLDLESPDIASRLVGVHATGGAGLLIDPSAPDASVIYTKTTPTPPFGLRMPFNQAPLDEATVACVLRWVTAQVDGGAGDDGSASIGDAAHVEDGTSSGGDDGPSGEGAAPVRDAGSKSDARPKDASAPDVAAEAATPEAGVPGDGNAD